MQGDASKGNAPRTAVEAVLSAYYENLNAEPPQPGIERLAELSVDAAVHAIREAMMGDDAKQAAAQVMREQGAIGPMLEAAFNTAVTSG